MQLRGSCRCGAVHFVVESWTPYPFMRCYCSICRKTQGGGGYAINIMAQAETLSVEGRTHVEVYHAMLDDPDAPGEQRQSEAQRHFCVKCASALWIGDPRWPEWVYPFASAIDTPLPTPPERVHIMLGSKASWVEVPEGPNERHFEEYPEEAIIDWHKRLGLYVGPP